jgi:predicted O-methyltransferase YrrM
MDFIANDILRYCEQHSMPEPQPLRQLSRTTQAKVLNPRMLSGHLQGRFLALFSKLIRPKHILEIGTYTGYATLCLCEGLDEEGHVTTIEINDELEPYFRTAFKSSRWAEKITSLIGDAKQLLTELYGPFDLVFIDADKSEYPAYYAAIIDKVRPGGLIIVDNVLWSGHVLKKPSDQDPETQIIDQFNRDLTSDSRVEALMLPIRDGLSVLRRV